MLYEHVGKLLIVTESINICCPFLLIGNLGKLTTCLDVLGS